MLRDQREKLLGCVSPLILRSPTFSTDKMGLGPSISTATSHLIRLSAPKARTARSRLGPLCNVGTACASPATLPVALRTEADRLEYGALSYLPIADRGKSFFVLQILSRASSVPQLPSACLFCATRSSRDRPPARTTSDPAPQICAGRLSTGDQTLTT